MHQLLRTGRALQLEGLTESQNKVTLGFKCNPNLKLTLAEEANKCGMSLSEYVEVLVNNRHNTTTNPNLSENSQLEAQVSNLSKKLAFFYEHPLIVSAYKKNKGQLINYTGSSGKHHADFINSIEDVYKVLFNIVNLK